MKHRLIRFLCVLCIFVLTVSSAFAYTKLTKGAYGSEVLAMQQALQALGYPIATDGKYGAATMATVKTFQREHGLTTDGVAGNQTLSLLYSLAPSFAPDAAHTTPVPAANSIPATVTTTGGSLNLRFSAGAAAQVITTIPNGTVIDVTQYGPVWCAAVYNGYAGYVMTEFLRFSTVNTPTPVPAPSSAPTPVYNETTATVTTTGGSLNLRESARENARVLTTIPYGTRLDVLSRGDSWSWVVYQNYIGYVMSKFLTFGSVVTPTPTPVPAPTPSPTSPVVPGGQTAYVSTSGGSLNLRQEASSGARILTTIPNGTQITVYSRGSSWCSVYYFNGSVGMTGYVMTSFLYFPSSAVTPTPTPTVTSTPSSGTVSALVTTSGGSLNLRESASASARVLTTLPNASTVLVTSRGSDWCAVTYRNISGYVMTKFLTFINGSSATVPPTAEEDDPSVYKRTLKSGMTGDDVLWVQGRLLELGYDVSITSSYDSKTVSAVKAFQSQNGLSVDGLAGSQTFAILRSANARRASDSPLTYATLRIDNTGEGVTSLQNALKQLGYAVTVNGTYDVATHNAVVAFQQRNGLVISGIADGLTRQVLHGGSGMPYSTAVAELPASEGRIAGPAVQEIRLLHWQNEIKPNVRAGQTITIFDPNTSLSWNLVFYSLGRHADSQPASWRDTQIMNRSFGSTSWTIHPVYVLLPNGQWTIATMHNRPHLTGTIYTNGFGGHLCVHFLRTMSEAQANDPEYGVQNQEALRKAWKELTGETIDY